MADLCIAFDPSSSVTKAFYTSENCFTPELITMDTDVIEISQEIIEHHLAHRIGEPLPIDEAWLEVKTRYYAVGYLAKHDFYTTEPLKEIKSKRIIYKILALIGVIACQKNLETKLSINLGILLPFGEFEDKEDRLKLIEQLKIALKNFRFRGISYKVHLERIDCLPEGAGLLMRGIESDVPQNNVLVLMIGYRNASYLLQINNNIKKGKTTALGMIRMLDSLKISGLSSRELIKFVSHIQPKNNSKDRIKELICKYQVTQTEEEIQKNIYSARQKHWAMLKNWLESEKLGEYDLDLVVSSGGTASYYQKEIEQYFQQIPMNWGEKMEEKIKDLLKTEEQKNLWHHRLTDAFAYLYWLHYVFAL